MENNNSDNNQSKNARIKNRKSVVKIWFVSGLVLILASVLMLIFGAGMFASRGYYSQTEIRLSEFCFIFWLPFLITGALITLAALVIKLIRSPK